MYMYKNLKRSLSDLTDTIKLSQYNTEVKYFITN